METKSVIERVVNLVGVEDILEILSDKLSWSDLQTLMLYIYERRVKKLSTVEVTKNQGDNRFSAIATVDPRELLEIDRLLYHSLPATFLPIELSPVTPIGANVVLTSLDPKVTLATIRNVEVVSDHSMVLSLECAKRRKDDRKLKDGGQEIHLAASHRPLRLQKFPKEFGFTPHFRSFALVSAARDTQGFNSFELRAFGDHISTWLDFLVGSEAIGYRVKEISVAISDIRLMENLLASGRIKRAEASRRTQDPSFSLFRRYSIDLPKETDHAKDIVVPYLELETYINEMRFTEEKLVEPLREKYPFVRFFFDLERCAGVGYYSGICYKISARTFGDDKHFLAGGGACDWTRKLLQSKREHLVASGFGSELFLRKFKVL